MCLFGVRKTRLVKAFSKDFSCKKGDVLDGFKFFFLEKWVEYWGVIKIVDVASICADALGFEQMKRPFPKKYSNKNDI